MNQHRHKRDSRRQEKHSQGKAGGSSPGESDGEAGSKEEVAGAEVTVHRLTTHYFHLKPQAINDWSKQLKATLKPLFFLWHEGVLPLTQLGQVEKLSCLKGCSSPTFSPRSCTICTWDPPHLPCFSPSVGEQLLLPGTLRLIILGSSAQCLDLENLFR